MLIIENIENDYKKNIRNNKKEIKIINNYIKKILLKNNIINQGNYYYLLDLNNDFISVNKIDEYGNEIFEYYYGNCMIKKNNKIKKIKILNNTKSLKSIIEDLKWIDC